MTEKHEKKASNEGKEIRKEAFKKLALIFAIILLAVNTIQLSHFGGLVERVDQYNKGVVDELGAIRGDVFSFGSDLNEIRSFLLLPTKKYSFSQQSQEIGAEEEKESSRTGQAIYAFLDKIAAEENLKKNSVLAEEKITSLAGDNAFIDALKNNGLQTGKPENLEEAFQLKISDEKGAQYFALLAGKSDGALKIQSALGTSKIAEQDYEKQKVEIVNYFTANKDKVIKLKDLLAAQKEGLLGLFAGREIAGQLGQKKITFDKTPVENNEAFIFSLKNKEDEELMAVSIRRADGQFVLDNKNYADLEQLKAPLIEKVNGLDASTALEKMIRERKTELEAIFKEEAFSEMLKAAGLQIGAPREEYNKIMYDVSGADQKKVFSFAIELSSGLYKVVRGDEETDLFNFLDSMGLKKKP